MHLDIERTIVGPATAPGLGARSALRMSGPNSASIALGSLDIAEPLAWTDPFARDVVVRIEGWTASIEARFYFWPAGRSYTGQESIELWLLASAPLMSAIERDWLGRGARLARPGEFTLRAFLAGRLDLVQAEAVRGLIEAESIDELSSAIDQRTGGVSRRIADLQGRLLDLLADLEAGLDFAEEDIRFLSDAELIDRLECALADLSNLDRSLGSRAIQVERYRLVLAGPVNAGKSSLFNVLAGDARALVSEQPGTTRDYNSAEIRIAGRCFELLDTAGVEGVADAVSMTAERARLALCRSATLVLWCVPIAEPIPIPVSEPSVPRDKTILVRTKLDLAPEAIDPAADCHVTVRRPGGIEPLRRAIEARLALSDASVPAGIGAAPRCREGLDRASQALDSALVLVRDRTGAEYVAPPLREAIDALGELVGSVYTEDLLDRIFSRFCIGK